MGDIVNKGLGLVGIAKQATKGTPAHHAWYAHALVSGKPIEMSVTQAPDAVTSGSRTERDVIRTAATAGLGPFTTHAYLRSLGLYLLGVYGTVVDAGTVGAYTHLYSVADSLPLFTGWGLVGSEYQQVSDVKVSDFDLSWDGPGPAVMSITAPGSNFDAHITPAWTMPAGLNNEDGSQSFLIPTGGTFKIAALGDTPVVANISGGDISISNGLEAVPNSATILPGIQAEKKQVVNATLKVIPSDLSLWRTILTGSPTGNSIQEEPAYGSFEVEFEEEGAGTGKLNLRAHKVAFLCDFPDVDPAGGYVELNMVGACMGDGTNDPIIPTLTNAVQFYGTGEVGS